jgi:hypothetical protein
MRHRLRLFFGAAPAVVIVAVASSTLFIDCFSGTPTPEPNLVGDASRHDGSAKLDGGSPEKCTASFAASDAGQAATVRVDTSTVVNTFVPRLLFGINSGYFISQEDSLNTQGQVQAAGNYTIRYPGGSSSDDYHWNGAGKYDANHYWVPSATAFTVGFPGTEIYRGTTSSSYGTPANLTDGNLSTRWLSNVDTAFPTAQWAYVDLGSTAQVTSLQIVWATPFATSFQVQTWNGAASYPPPYGATGGTWETTSAGSMTGTGGTQTVTFNAVSAEFVRVLMNASSAGASGAYSVAELIAFNGTTQLTTNTSSISQSPTTVSSTDPANAPAPESNFDFESFMAYVRSFKPAAEPVITVNVGTGTAAEAAAWVHYANVVQRYGIRYWQIGNEMEGDWETGGPLNAQDYVRRYIEYYDAMKAEDPTITILGPVSGGMNEVSNLPDGKLFVQDFIGVLHAAGKNDHINAIDFHWYPNYGPVSDAVALATPSQIGAFSMNVASWLSAASVTGNVPVFMSEYNIGLGASNTPVYANQLVNGLWEANALGEFIHYFGNGGNTDLWNLINSWTSTSLSDPTAGDLGYLQHDVNAYRYQPHADYWALRMMSSDWAINGDTRTHKLVASTSTQALLATYADLRPDGALGLAVVNKDESNAYSATLDLSPFSVGPAADVWTFDSANYAWETRAVPYHAEPDLAPTHTLTCGASSSTPFTFAPGSITVFRFAPPGAPTAVITDAGAPPPAPTNTLLIDDMSNASAQIELPPQQPGDIAGYWYTYIGGGSGQTDTGSITPLAQSELADGGSAQFDYTAIGETPGATIAAPRDAGTLLHAACAWGKTPAAQYAYAAEGFTFELAPTDGGGFTPDYDNISAHKGLQFWMYNALKTTTVVQLEIGDKESDPRGGICSNSADASALDQCNSPVSVDLVVSPGWTLETVPFATLVSNPGYGYQQPAGGDMKTATSVNFQVNQPKAPDAGGVAVSFDFCIAYLEFYN